MLNLVNQHRRAEAVEEALGVILGQQAQLEVVERDVAASRLGQVPEEGGLADLSGTGKQQHREEAIGGLERLAEMSVDVHAGLLFARCFLVSS